jgi:putative transposase
MDKINRATYSTDLNDTEWKVMAPLLPQPTEGRPRVWPLREILNALFYLVQAGCAWRLLPHEFPPWKTVYSHFWRWRKAGRWEQLNAALVEIVRQRDGRDRQPSAAVIDSQSVKSAEGGTELGVAKRVYKKTHGRKRHIVVDTLGLLLLVVVHSASVPDGNGGKVTLQALFDRIKRSVHNRWCRLKKIWADGPYEDIVTVVQHTFGWTLEVVRRPDGAKGFVVLARRWVVERTFAWLTRSRRLARDYERRPATHEAMVYVASIRRMLKLCNPSS